MCPVLLATLGGELITNQAVLHYELGPVPPVASPLGSKIGFLVPGRKLKNRPKEGRF